MYVRIIYRLGFLHLIALMLLYVTSISARPAPMERRSSQSSQKSQRSQSSVSSHLSHLSEEARIMNLQRQTEALFGPEETMDQQPIGPRHRSYDDIHHPSDDFVHYSRAGPPTLMRLGSSVISLPDLNQSPSHMDMSNIQESDWLTPRAERQFQEYFPSAVSRNQPSVHSASQSPRSLTPLAKPREASLQRTQMFQPPPPAPPAQEQSEIAPHRANICELCRKRFNNVKAFRDHQLEHINDEHERQTYICPICDAEFLGKTTMIHSHIPVHYHYNAQTNSLNLI